MPALHLVRRSPKGEGGRLGEGGSLPRRACHCTPTHPEACNAYSAVSAKAMFATWVYGKLTESHKAIFSRDPLPHHFPIKLIYRQLVFSHIKPIGNELLLQSHTEYGLITLIGGRKRRHDSPSVFQSRFSSFAFRNTLPADGAGTGWPDLFHLQAWLHVLRSHRHSRKEEEPAKVSAVVWYSGHVCTYYARILHFPILAMTKSKRKNADPVGTDNSGAAPLRV